MYSEAIQISLPSVQAGPVSPQRVLGGSPTNALYDVTPSSGPSPAAAICTG